MLALVGAKRHLDAAEADVGDAGRHGTATDMAYVGIFIFLGGLIGIPALNIGSLCLGFGVDAGTLIGALVAG